MKKNNFLIIFIIILVNFLFGCSKENENLLNPPSQNKTIFVNFLNLINDAIPRTLLLDSMSLLRDVNYLNISKSYNPPYDSTTLTILKGQSIEKNFPVKSKYIRNSAYTFIALPRINNNSELDTVLYLSTTSGIIKKKDIAFLQFFNAYPDSSTFDFKIGCQNGTPIAVNIPYKGKSTQIEMPVDDIAFSLTNNATKANYMFKFKFEEGIEYAFIIIKDNDGSPNLLVLNQYIKDENAISKLTKLSPNQQIFEINLANFSKISIDSLLINDKNALNSKVNSNQISNYKTIETCQSSSIDSILLFGNNNFVLKDFLSFNILKKYTAFVFGNESSQKLIIPNPYTINEELTNKSIIRVINGNYNHISLTLSVAARNSSSATNFTSGELLAGSLAYAGVSNPIIIKSGLLPMTLFTSYQPTKLLNTVLFNFEPGKRYNIVLHYDDSKKDSTCNSITIIEESSDYPKLEKPIQGGFFQLINGFSNIESTTNNISPILSNAKLFYGASLATVLNVGNNIINIAGISKSINIESNERNLVVISQRNQTADLISINYLPELASANEYKFRFINASDIENLEVRLNNDSSEIVANNLNYGVVSSYISKNLERKASYLFGTPLNDRKLKVSYRIDDVFLVFGKVYNIVFAGNSKNGYSAIIFQEF